ncbi:hypothetical protein VTG60DRAFT_1507 [Thermothelomyces hinnuleus]
MVKCNKCGEDSTKYAGFVKTLVACTSQGCVRGYKKCNSCTYLDGYMVKCCGSSDCAGTGKRKWADSLPSLLDGVEDFVWDFERCNQASFW